MTDKDKALDLALEALELSSVTVDSFGVQRKTQEAITAIKQALAAPYVASPRVQEPVGVYGHCPVCGAKGITRERRPGGDDRCANGHTYKSIHATTPPGGRQSEDCLTAAQRQSARSAWVGLTDDERNKIRFDYLDYDERARAIEAKLKEKNT